MISLHMLQKVAEYSGQRCDFSAFLTPYSPVPFQICSHINTKWNCCFSQFCILDSYTVTQDINQDLVIFIKWGIM